MGRPVNQRQTTHLNLVVSASSTPPVPVKLVGHTKGIHPVRRSRRGGMAKVEEYAPGGSRMSEGCVFGMFLRHDCGHGAAKDQCQDESDTPVLLVGWQKRQD